MGDQMTTKPPMKDELKTTPATKADVRRAIMAEDRRLRAKYKVLAYQDSIGAAIITGALVLNLGLAVAYALGGVPVIVAVLGIALGMSLLHEIEHDLIHNLYFSGNQRLQKAVLNLIWLVKLHANPFWRRKAHLRHHAKSGQLGDWEERLVGLGDRLGLRRLVTIVHPFGSGLYLKTVAATDPEFDAEKTRQTNLPAGMGFAVLSTLGLLNLLLPEPLHRVVPQSIWVFVGWLNVVWIVPGVVRHVAITVMATSVHYAGDIPSGEIRYENQIIDHWLYLPLQAFCFNFGATHVIHHYVAIQPFYLRQMVSAKVRPVLLAAGVRHNDLGILRRANRWHGYLGNGTVEDANAA